MSKARPAEPDDAAELVRLRMIMLAAVSGQEPQPGPWQQRTEATLRTRLDRENGSFVAYVVDDPGDSGRLAACAVGLVEYRLGGPHNPSGEVGYVMNVSTDPGHRRRGYSRACMTALLDWYRRRGIAVVDLRASVEGEPLYRSLGFVRTADPAMRLTLH
ncbi:MAG TPA: GNAT family N-acetyltransferase [Rugosimonospora sp.]|nr:GNAT family N-acetyltransferase [Rugosimonospora sp.]